MVVFGPLQLVVISLATLTIPASIADQLLALRDEGVIRVVDSVLASKNGDGDFDVVEVSDLNDQESHLVGTLALSLFEYGITGRLGALIGAKSGFLSTEAGDFGLSADQLLEVADLIPSNSKVLFLLIEHLWALELKKAVAGANGAVLANGWITPATLINSNKWAGDPLNGAKLFGT